MRETKAPVKNAMYSAATIFGKPSNKPIKPANLTSPNPIPRPRVATCKKKKRPKAHSADKKKLKVESCPPKEDPPLAEDDEAVVYNLC